MWPTLWCAWVKFMIYEQTKTLDTATKVLIVLCLIFVLAGMIVMGTVDWILLAMGLSLVGIVFGCIAMMRIENDDGRHVRFKRQ